MPLVSAVVPPDMNFDSKIPWSTDSIMIVPFNATQTLMNEAASILSIQTFLKLASLPFREEERYNAAAISPNGKVPVVKCGDYVVSELDGVMQLAQSKGVSLSAHLSAGEKADMRAYLSLVNNVLGNAMLYFCWIDQDIYEVVTWPRVGSPYNFPLNRILPWTMRRKMKSQLDALKWGHRQPEQVFQEVNTCLNALGERLGDAEYFFYSSPTELDAVVFGYLYTMITITLPTSQPLGNLVKQHRNLMQLVQRLEQI